MNLRRLVLAALFVFGFCATAQAADTLVEALVQGQGHGEIRFRDFQSNFEEDTARNAKDSAIGGLLYYQTAPLHNISAGVAVRGALDMGNSKSDRSYQMLPVNSENMRLGYAAMQEYWVKGEWAKTAIKLGAQGVTTPWLKTHEIRLLPKSYMGVTVDSRYFDNLRIQAMHLTDVLGWTDSHFHSVSKSYGNRPMEADRGVSIVGAEWTPVEGLLVKGYEYAFWDMFNNAYARVKYSHPLNDTVTAYGDLRYLYQNSIGDELVGECDSYMAGGILGMQAYGFDLQLQYAKIGDDTIKTRWGSEYIILQQVYKSFRAEDDCYGVQLGYDFSKLGLDGLSALAYYAYYDAPETGKNASFDLDELDFEVKYTFSGALEGWDVRVAHAFINGDNKHGGSKADAQDTRIYVNYKFDFDFNGLIED
ncbi:OprD family outer membrane porin [Pseudodesulfovibrio tunisiensis]|uniref:OprD family outer membrane porin n=1 Tax=Pseudodesulfovibrio tunisiensis TaxID=463192 RepID=UPI001FB34A33|nr:OprD family outer membrane porin [Pseudodesulfovibrio tunisiensis]